MERPVSRRPKPLSEPVASLKPKGKVKGFNFTPNWFGCYARDPVKHILYASAMGHLVFKLELKDGR